MRGHIVEEMAVLRSRVLGAMWGREAHGEQHGLSLVLLLGGAQEGNGVVGYQIGIVVLGIVKAVLDLLPIQIDAVVVVLGVHDQAAPLAPTRRYIGTVVLVQILAKVAGAIACVGQVGRIGARLVRRLPLWTRAVVVVREHHMVVHIHARQQRRSRWAAHGSGCVGVAELGASIAQQPQGAWHEIERAQLNVLIVGQDEDDVWPSLARGIRVTRVALRPTVWVAAMLLLSMRLAGQVFPLFFAIG